MPPEPPPSAYELPTLEQFVDAGDELIAVGADLAPGTLLAAYRRGLFPMPVSQRRPDLIGWFSPNPRGVIPLEGLRVSRSLRRSLRRYRCTVNQRFEAVIAACADPLRSGAWISPAITRAYIRLHQLGWAHSVEVWDDGDSSRSVEPRLVGGLYGVAIGGLFAGESMFSHATDASKVALVHLVELLRADAHPHRMLDTQWCTPHLASLGCIEVSRREYGELLDRAVGVELPLGWK